jgi:hypothetical protein
MKTCQFRCVVRSDADRSCHPWILQPLLSRSSEDRNARPTQQPHSDSRHLQKYVGKQFTSLLSRSDIENYLPGLLTDENRVGIVLSRLKRMAA